MNFAEIGVSAWNDMKGFHYTDQTMKQDIERLFGQSKVRDNILRRLKSAPIAKSRISTLKFGHETLAIGFVVPQNPGSDSSPIVSFKSVRHYIPKISKIATSPYFTRSFGEKFKLNFLLFWPQTSRSKKLSHSALVRGFHYFPYLIHFSGNRLSFIWSIHCFWKYDIPRLCFLHI